MAPLLTPLPAVALTPGLWVEVPEAENAPWGWHRLSSVKKEARGVIVTGQGWEYTLPSSLLLLTALEEPKGVPPRRSNPAFDVHFLSLANAVGQAARCRRRQVGAVLVSFPEDDFPQEVATGFNSYPWGVPGCWEGACPRGLASSTTVEAYSSYEDATTAGYCASRHAEMMALQRAGGEARGSTLYCTDKPCHNCHKHLAHAGVARMVWPGGEAPPLALYTTPTDSHFSGLRRLPL